ncbi:MAG: hypothetical protein K8T26_07200 [Lentisphaerae bacterium]|nr:hypothetical protein [Lentisphaerota bacterium]
MKPLKPIRQVGEAILVLAALAIIPLFPRALVVRLAWGMGDVGRWCSPSLRRLARANLDLAFGDSKSEADKAAIVRESYRVFALMLLDLFWFAVFSQRRLRRWVTFDDSIHHYQATRPALVVTAHFGNWEVTGQATVLLGETISSVATPVKNPVVEYILGVVRGRTGQEIARRAGAVKAMLAVIRRGGRIALLLDQNTLPHEGGLFVNFFGLPVPVSRAAASLARHTKAAVVMGYCKVDAAGRYRVFAQAPLFLHTLDETAATQVIIDRVEAIIRDCPGHWLWMYKRWKYVPAGAPRERYPYYARPAPEA